MPWPPYSGLSSRLVLRLRGSGGGRAGDDGVVGGGGCSSKRLLKRGLPRARTLPVCGRGVIGPILSGQGETRAVKNPKSQAKIKTVDGWR